MANNYSYKDATAVTLTAKSTDTASVHTPHVNVDTLPALSAGTANIGDVDILSIAAGDNNIGNVDIVTMPTVTINSPAVTNAGTFAVQESGAALTALQLIDNAVSGAGFNVTQMNGVNLSMGSGVNGTGVQRVSIATDDTNAAAQTTALQLIDNAVSGTGFNISQINGVTPLMGSGATGTGSHRVTAATDSPEVTALQIMDDWDNGASDGASVSGDVAHDSADAGEPVKIGGKGLSADPTAVATNDRVNALFDLLGKQVVLPYAIPENFVSGAITTAMTATTSTSLVAAPGAGLRNYITQITVSNAHATVGTDVAIQDGSGGTTLYTIPAAALYGGATVTFPTPLRQPTANTALFCANVTTGASTKASASGYKAV